jgi:hypothetical protein
MSASPLPAVDAETALEEVLALLGDPPEPGGADDDRFGARLRQVIAASIPLEPGDDPDDTPVLVLGADLRRRLEAVARKRSSGHYFGDHPEGIGPTLGMDLGLNASGGRDSA